MSKYIYFVEEYAPREYHGITGPQSSQIGELLWWQ